PEGDGSNEEGEEGAAAQHLGVNAGTPTLVPPPPGRKAVSDGLRRLPGDARDAYTSTVSILSSTYARAPYPHPRPPRCAGRANGTSTGPRGVSRPPRHL